MEDPKFNLALGGLLGMFIAWCILLFIVLGGNEEGARIIKECEKMGQTIIDDNTIICEVK